MGGNATTTAARKPDASTARARHLVFAPNDKANASVTAYLQSETGSSQEAAWQERMQQQGVEIAPHVGDARERQVLVKGNQRPLTRQAKAQGFG